MKENKPELVNTQSISQQLPTPVAMTFSRDEDIDFAFTRLSAAVANMIKHTNLKDLQTACIEKARSPKCFTNPVESFQSLRKHKVLKYYVLC